jgi:NAD(P) transhydrogenase
MTHRFDLIVIGSGPAGEKAAAQAAYYGKKVALVEKSPFVGGAAVSSAGIPTKTLREAASYLTGFRRREVYGVAPDLTPVDLIEHLRTRALQVFETMTEEVHRNIERHGIELVHGFASLDEQRRVEVRLPDGTVRELSGRVILIATGSRPRHPPEIPFEDEDVMDSQEVFDIREPFGDLVVIGGSTIGCEFASIFAAAGASVTLIDRSDRLLKVLDKEVSHVLADAFRNAGMKVVLGGGRRPLVDRDEAGVRVTLGSGEVLHPEKVFYSAGRSGNTEGLGLEKAGVALDGKGRIVVDQRFRTTAEGIYAAGDVIGPPSLASTSMEQGRVATCYAFDIPFKRAVDPLAPIGVYSIPEVAMVGLSEQAARELGIDFEVGRSWFSRNSRALIGGTTDGFVKLIFERGSRRLLGVHIVNEAASELVHLGQSVIQFDGTIDHFIDSTYNVPTLTDAYKYAAYDGLGRLHSDRSR